LSKEKPKQTIRFSSNCFVSILDTGELHQDRPRLEIVVGSARAYLSKADCAEVAELGKMCAEFVKQCEKRNADEKADIEKQKPVEPKKETKAIGEGK